jgi:transcriptional regulator with XRE-family HTH domain
MEAMARTNQQLGTTLHRLRTAAGQTLRELEAKSGVNRSVISRLESGEYQQPRPNTLTRLAEALGADASQLLTAAGYTANKADALPNLPVYLRSKYGHLPADARKELTDYVAKLEAEYGGKPKKKVRPATKNK